CDAYRHREPSRCRAARRLHRLEHRSHGNRRDPPGDRRSHLDVAIIAASSRRPLAAGVSLSLRTKFMAIATTTPRRRLAVPQGLVLKLCVLAAVGVLIAGPLLRILIETLLPGTI